MTARAHAGVWCSAEALVMTEQAQDQSLADADQTAANADQKVSGLDQRTADSDDAIADLDQRASDRDQALADHAHNLLAVVTDAAQRAYDASKYARKIISGARQANRLKRARTGRDRVAAAGQRDRTAAERDERGLERDAGVGSGQTASSGNVGAHIRGLEEAMTGSSVDSSTWRVMRAEMDLLQADHKRLLEEEEEDTQSQV
jgi:hypothetical protein